MNRTHAYIKCLGLWLCILGNLLSGYAWSAACDAVFSGGVQSHDANGRIHMMYESRIFGGGTVLTTPQLTMTHHWQNQRGMCNESLGDASVCTASGFPAEKSNPVIPTHSYMPATFLTGPGGEAAVNVSYRGTRVLSGEHYAAINLGQEGVLTFSGSSPNMTMRALTTNFAAVTQFYPGNYWIDGNVTLAQLTTIRRMGSQAGAVNIYIRGNLIAGNSELRIENFSETRPLNIYALGNMNFGNNTIIHGSLYATGNISLSVGSRIYNGVYASSINTGVNVHISYSNLHQEHFLGSMVLNNNQVEVNFQPGDYYFNGNLSIGVSAIIRNLRGSERPVRIFVNGSIMLSHAVTFDNFANGQLLIYAAGSIHITSQNDVRAFIYAAGDVQIDFSNNSRYIGGISGHNVTIGQGSIVQYVEPRDLGALCTDDAAVAYYVLSHATPGLTCMAEPVTISAYDANNQPVAPSSGTQLVLSATPGTGAWVGGNTWTFSGTESSVVKYLQQTSPAVLSLGASDGTAVGNSSLEFLDAALKWYGDNLSPAIPNMVAGENSYVTLRVVRTNTDTGACQDRLVGPQDVQVLYECRNPDSCVIGQSFTIGGVPIPDVNSNVNDVDVSLILGSPVPLNYSDVGQVRLHAQLPLAASGNDPAITLTGTSNEFVVKPHTLAVSSVTSASNIPKPGTTSSGSGFVAAGEPFRAQIEVRNAQGNRTPNFGNEIVPQSVRVDFENLIYPAGGNAGVLSGTDSFIADTVPGRFVSQNLSWNEAGSIEFLPALVGNDYLGAGAPPDHISSGTVGRFYPSAFHLASHSITDACTGFSYLSQPQLGVNYRLEARAQGGNITTNYDNNTLVYAGAANISYVAEHHQSGDGAAWISPSRLDIDTANWTAGVMQVSDQTAMVTRLAATHDGPYEALQLGLQLQDTLDNRPLNGLNFNPLVAGNCSGTDCTAIALGDPIALRFGRLRMDDAHGPETNNLPVNFVTEYWDGNRFVPTYDDQCTRIPRSAITYPSGPISTDSNRTVTLGSGTTQGNYAGLDTDNIIFSSGNAGHFFTAPGANNTGSFAVNVSLLTLPWLRYDWNQDGLFDDPSLPPTTISFGSFRGHDRVIYWREVLE